MNTKLYKTLQQYTIHNSYRALQTNHTTSDNFYTTIHNSKTTRIYKTFSKLYITLQTTKTTKLYTSLQNFTICCRRNYTTLHNCTKLCTTFTTDKLHDFYTNNKLHTTLQHVYTTLQHFAKLYKDFTKLYKVSTQLYKYFTTLSELYSTLQEDFFKQKKGVHNFMSIHKAIQTTYTFLKHIQYCTKLHKALHIQNAYDT